jgi:hypothetical protein
VDRRQTPSDPRGGKRGLELRGGLESCDTVFVSYHAVLSYRGDHRLLRVAKQHRRNPFPYRILLL